MTTHTAAHTLSPAELDKLPLHFIEGVENGGYYLASDVLRAALTGQATSPAQAAPSEQDERALFDLAFARAKALGRCGMEFAAHLCQLGVTTIKGTDYVRRDSVMNEVMAWRNAFDAAPEVPVEAIRTRAAQGASGAPTEPPVLPQIVRDWMEAEKGSQEAIEAYNEAVRESDRHIWPGTDINAEFQVMSAAKNKAFHAMHAMYDYLAAPSGASGAQGEPTGATGAAGGEMLELLRDAARAWNNEDDSELDETMGRIECFLLDARAAASQAAPGVGAGLLNAEELAALRRFDECAQDGEGYDVPKEMMQRLAEIGVVRRKSGAYYQATDFGQMVLGNAPHAPVVRADVPAEDHAICRLMERNLLGKISELEAKLAASPSPSAPQGQEAAPRLMRQAVGSVASNVDGRVAVNWMRPERLEAGTLLYCAREPVAAPVAGEAPACPHCDGKGEYQHKDQDTTCRVCGGSGHDSANGGERGGNAN